MHGCTGGRTHIVTLRQLWNCRPINMLWERLTIVRNIPTTEILVGEWGNEPGFQRSRYTVVMQITNDLIHSTDLFLPTRAREYARKNVTPSR